MNLLKWLEKVHNLLKIVLNMQLTNSINTLEMTFFNFFILTHSMQRPKTGNHFGDYQRGLQPQSNLLILRIFYIVHSLQAWQHFLQKFIKFLIQNHLEHRKTDYKSEKLLRRLKYNNLFLLMRKQRLF